MFHVNYPSAPPHQTPLIEIIIVPPSENLLNYAQHQTHISFAKFFLVFSSLKRDHDFDDLQTNFNYKTKLYKCNSKLICSSIVVI